MEQSEGLKTEPPFIIMINLKQFSNSFLLFKALLWNLMCTDTFGPIFYYVILNISRNKSNGNQDFNILI